MKRSQERGQPERKSARLARTKARVDGSEEFGLTWLGDAHFKSGSEDKGITVGQVEVVVIPGPDQAARAGPEVQEEREASVDELSSNKSDIMPSMTRLKYNRFKGDGSQDVDDWLTEFKSTAIANQEEPATILRIFQGLLKGEALKWYQDVPERIRTNWEQLSSLFLRTFREAGGETRALGRLSKMTMGKSESIRRYGQRVKALIQKLTTEISPTVQVEWYVAGFPEKMGFQIRQARPTTLNEAMEAAQNYENSAQSLRKSLKGLEKREKLKSGKKDRRRKKHSDTSETSDSSSSTRRSSNTESSGSDLGPSSGKRSNRNRKGKEIRKVKIEDDEQKQFMKNIQKSLEAIKVNLADNRKPRRIVPTSRTNVWCTGCGENGHYASECYKGLQKQVHFVDPKTGVYYTIPDEDEESETNPVYRVQPVYGRGKGVTPLIRTDPGQKSGQIGPSQVVVQQRFPVGVCWNCGDPSHSASACPLRAGQGAPLPLPCQKCGEQGHNLPRYSKPLQVRSVYKQVEILPREQTGLNYGSTVGVENPGK